MRIITSITMLLSLTVAARSSPQDMKGEEIKQLVAGALVEIDTPLGKKIPVQYDGSGRISGNAGELASYLGSPSDKGRWWISGDQLCNKWNKWFSGETQCLKLSREGRRFRWTNQAGTSGTAEIASAAPAIRTAPQVAASEGSTPRMRVAGPVASSVAAAIAPRKPPTSQAAIARSATAVPAASAASAAPGGSHRVANVEAGDVLNVRGGPSADDEIVGSIEAEQDGISLAGECRGRWCPITHAGISGWVNVAYLVPASPPADRATPRRPSESRIEGARDGRDAPRTCLTEPARALLDTIEQRFGPVRTISTCRPGATIAGTGHPSRHASGNAVDFDAGSRKSKIVDWLVANHREGGTMTYADMDHIHVDIGRHFVSLAGRRVRSARSDDDNGDTSRDWPRRRMGLSGPQVR